MNNYISEDLIDFNNIKDKIFFRLGSHNDKEKHDNLVSRNLLGVTVYYYVLIDNNDDYIKSFRITWEIISRWQIDEEELYAIAFRNTPKLFPCRVVKIAELIKELKSSLLNEDKLSDYDPPLYVVTSESKVYGAGSIIYPGLAKWISEVFDGDYYIIPSSIHEVIIVPIDCCHSREFLLSMLREINRKELSEEEFLSDDLYLYSTEKDCISIA